MGLVSTWLNGIGLGHAVANFKAAGIVTPSALAELDVTHYVALGVTDPADRRKLFYLVQRIKMATKQGEDDQEHQEILDTQQEIESVVSRTLSSKTFSADEEDSLIADDEGEDDDGDQTSGEPAEQMKPKVKAGRRSGLGAAAARTGAKSQAPHETKENRLQNVPVTRSRAKASSFPFPNSSMSPVSQSDSNRVTVRNRPIHREGRNVDDSEMDESVGRGDSEWEDESLIADDEASAKGSKGRRFSRRLQEQRMARERQSVSSIENLEETDDGAPPSRRLSRSRSDTGYSADLESSKTKHSGRVSRERSTSDLDADDESSIKTPSTRKSGMQAPKTRRFESKLAGPTRTGKQLSTIPSDTVAPMSPLVSLAASQMDADITSNQRVEQKRRTNAVTTRKRSGARSKSLTSTVSSDTESDYGGTGLVSGRQSAASTSGSDTEAQVSGRLRHSLGSRQSTGNLSARSRRVSASNLQSLSSRRSSSGRDLIKADLGLDKKHEARSKVFVHGAPVNNSWSAQVAKLRDDNQSEHELFQHSQTSSGVVEEMRIRVIVRKRPMSTSEFTTKKDLDIIHPLECDSYGRILVYQPKTRVDLTREVETVPFAFDNVFGESSTNRDIYHKAVRTLIPGVFEGKWASVFAYGQTGSGKTFTMMGSNVTGIKAGTAMKDKSNYGLYFLAALDVFSISKQEQYKHLSIGASLFEIYGGKLFDLLNDRKQVKCLEDHKGRVCFPGLSEHPVASATDLMKVIEAGATNRSTGTTSKNADSSRSHAVLQLSLRKSVGRRSNVEHGRLTFIDLAGSERGADTAKASRATRLEGAEINTSLLALKEVIRALATGDSMAHIPFRGSKLTQVLKESFVGENSRTVMVACIAPNMGNCEHTLNTLRYADRVKERDAETGNLSASVASGRIRSSRRVLLPSFESMNPPMEDDGNNTLEEDDDDDVDDDLVSEQRDSFDTDDEDDLFSDEVNQPVNLDAIPAYHSSLELQLPAATFSEDNAATSELITAHRSIMTEMLRMVKDEMTLVHNADADRDTIDHYLGQLSEIQEKQVTMLTMLHEKLLQCKGTIAPPDSAEEKTKGLLFSDDDSFEDLRD